MATIKLLSLFSGIGAFEKALKNLNIEYELVGYSEIDKYASKSYSLIHKESEEKNLGDITRIKVDDLPKNIDLITYGFPCQDISIAGNTQGFFNSNGEKTRSGLFFNALNIIQAVQPKIAIAENVKNLTGKRFKNEFETVLNSLQFAGYNNYYKVLNAKDYGIPQNRERVFIVSIRKDLDNGIFEFPQPIELTKKLEDILENNVEQIYYFGHDKKTKIKNTNYKKDNYIDITNKIINNEINEFKIMDYRYDEGLRIRKDNICPTLTTKSSSSMASTPIVYKNQKLRSLTPKECFRLMGFDDNDIDILIENKISNNQLYKMAGNSICVPVLENIFNNLKGELNVKHKRNTTVYK